MGLLDLLGIGKRKAMMTDALKKGALIVDVRSRNEFQGGHVDGAINIPLDSVAGKLDELKSKNKPVVFCCASGMRSGIATNKAKTYGLEAFNGGGWTSLNGLIQNTKER